MCSQTKDWPRFWQTLKAQGKKSYNRTTTCESRMKQDPHLSPRNEPTLRDAILSDPSVVLEDMDVMRALMQAHDATRGGNIIDMRGLAMNRLEERLGRLEDTHRTVI